MTQTSGARVGPVDYAVVELPMEGSRFGGAMVTELVRRVDTGTIRLIAVLILSKRVDGSVKAPAISDVLELEAIGADLAELLGAVDVGYLAAAMDPGSIAAAVLWDNRQDTPWAVTAQRLGGELVAAGRLPLR